MIGYPERTQRTEYQSPQLPPQQKKKTGQQTKEKEKRKCNREKRRSKFQVHNLENNEI